MKIKEITEMAMKGPNYTTVADNFAAGWEEYWKKNGTYEADIDQYKVLKCNKYYSVWDGDVLVAVTSLDDLTSVVDDVWVNEKYRGQKLFSKLLWFYKTRLGRNKLVMGNIHSTTMQEVVKGLSRFKKSWVNSRTHDVQPFSIDTLDDFYSHTDIGEWKLVLENNGVFEDWPKFNTGTGFMKETYTGYID